MAENEDGQEKSQEPTGKRLEDARKKGQVPRSRELNTMAVTLLGTAAVMMFSGHFGRGIEELFRANFALTRADMFDVNAMVMHLQNAARIYASLLAPILVVTVAVALVASVALGGFALSAEAMAPSLAKLNPIKGLKRVFGWKGLLELVKSLAKFVLIAGTAIWILWLMAADIIGLGAMDFRAAFAEGAWILGWSALVLASTMIVMALVDVPFQLWDHRRQLKMTQQEVRDELKQTEGRPEVRSRIRQLQREFAQARMIEQVPKADVIVTNPTHYAVALRYDQQRMQAPVVVAKGVALVAANIRRVGDEHRVPIVEAPMLARSIYHTTELNESIPAGLYLAVAQLLAYVFQLRASREFGEPKPAAPREYPIPPDLRHE